MANTEGRICTCCEEFKLWEEFHNKPKGKNGRNSQCMKCVNLKSRGKKTERKCISCAQTKPLSDYPSYSRARQCLECQAAKSDKVKALEAKVRQKDRAKFLVLFHKLVRQQDELNVRICNLKQEFGFTEDDEHNALTPRTTPPTSPRNVEVEAEDKKEPEIYFAEPQVTQYDEERLKTMPLPEKIVLPIYSYIHYTPSGEKKVVKASSDVVEDDEDEIVIHL